MAKAILLYSRETWVVREHVCGAPVGPLCSGSARMESSSPSLSLSLSLMSQPILPLLGRPVCLGFVVLAKKKQKKKHSAAEVIEKKTEG